MHESCKEGWICLMAQGVLKKVASYNKKKYLINNKLNLTEKKSNKEIETEWY